MASDEDAFYKAMKLLKRYSLVESSPGLESYSMHPVIHEWITHRTKDAKTTTGQMDMAETATSIVAQAAREYIVTLQYHNAQHIVQHGIRCMALICQVRVTERHCTILNKTRISVIGHLFRLFGRSSLQLELLEWVLEKFRSPPGGYFESFVDLSMDLAEAHLVEQNLDKTVRLLEEAISISPHVPNEYHGTQEQFLEAST